MRRVVGHLDGAAALRLSDGAVHAVRHLVGVHDDQTFGVAGRTADGLDQAGLTAEEAFFIGVEDGHKAHLGQIEALTQ